MSLVSFESQAAGQLTRGMNGLGRPAHREAVDALRPQTLFDEGEGIPDPACHGDLIGADPTGDPTWICCTSASTISAVEFLDHSAQGFSRCGARFRLGALERTGVIITPVGGVVLIDPVGRAWWIRVVGRG